ncbi:MAG TPA: Gfo/Idh/MocA family oxidoreductase [Ohtaekwangia sp.]|nr:Gfo/Idh/MocA family oxidoreductase [Ohtaekwangia sp.]
MKTTDQYSRRKFIHTSLSLGVSAASAFALSGLASSCQGKTQPESKSEEKTSAPQVGKKLGIALVGLGQYSSEQLAPALKETTHCYLAGAVTGTPDKAEKWKKKYDLPHDNVYSYETFDAIKDNPDIDIIYVVLPNAMHKEYVVRAARAGKHVICEKPMAITVADCDEMIAACKQAGKMLSIGYRLHFDPYNKEMMRLGQDKIFGEIKRMEAENGQKKVDGWRLHKELAGGGPLMDLGIYCVQGVRYTTGLEPIAVIAQEGQKTDLKKFSEVEESITWQMEMPGGIVAACKSSYSENYNKLRAEAAKGYFELSPAYAYKGIRGKTTDTSLNFKSINQQAAQMDDFAQAIKDGRPTPVPGEMGRQDVKILQAIYESMRTKQRVAIA